MRFSLLFLILSMCLSAIGSAQVVDDSTKIINGYSNTIYVHAQDIIQGNTSGRRLDTALVNFQETDEFLNLNGERQKNLGYISSPQQPLFYYHRRTIGRSLGLNATAYLAIDPDSVRYFRNYNVYSRIKYNQGSYGRQWIQVEAAKNLASNFNIGFTFRRLTAQKQIGVTTNREKQSDHTVYGIHFNTSLFNNHYILLGSFSNMKQTLTESGGILPKSPTSIDDLYDFDISPTQFTNNPTSIERRRSGRLHNIFRIDTALPHLIVSAGLESYRYQFYLPPQVIDATAGRGKFGKYENFYLRDDSTYNNIAYDQVFVNPRLVETLGDLQLEVGWNYRHHRYANQFRSLNEVNEQIYSARGTYNLPFGTLSADIAYIPGRDKAISATYRSKWLYASISQSSVSPSFVSQTVFSNHFTWQNNFTFEQVLQAEAGLSFSTKLLQGSVGFRNQTIRNGIFYSTAVTPIQEGSSVNNLVLTASARLSIAKFYWENKLQTANPNRQDLTPQPRLFLQSSPGFLFSFKQGRYQVNPGVQAWYRTAFNGQAYDPSLGLFYLQAGGSQLNAGFPKSQQLGSYLWTAIYVNIKINNTRGYIKLGNATQDILGLGFFDVPFYPGQRRYFEFGLDWVFFD